MKKVVFGIVFIGIFPQFVNRIAKNFLTFFQFIKMLAYQPF